MSFGINRSNNNQKEKIAHDSISFGSAIKSEKERSDISVGDSSISTFKINHSTNYIVFSNFCESSCGILSDKEKLKRTFLSENTTHQKVKQLMQNLESRDKIIYKKSEDELSKMGDSVLPYLKKALISENTLLNIRIIEVLGLIGSPKSVKMIIQEMKNKKKSHVIRNFSISTIDKLNMEYAIDDLIDILSDESEKPKIRIKSAKILAKFCDYKSAKALFDASECNDKKVRMVALKLLLDNEKIIPHLNIIFNFPEKHYMLVYILTKMLMSKNEKLKYGAKGVLLENEYIVIPFLIKDLYEDNIKIIEKAEYVLVEMGEVVVPYLVSRLSSDDEKFILRVKNILIKINEPAFSYLINNLGSSNYEIFEKTENILVSIGKPAIPHLIKAFANSNDRIFNSIVYVLEKIGSLAAPDLINALDDDNPRIRNGAKATLLKIKKQAVSEFAKALSSPNTRISLASSKILIEVGPSVIPTVFESMVNDSNWLNNQGVVFQIFIVFENESASYLLEQSSNEDENVRDTARYMLNLMGDRAVPELLKKLDSKNSNERKNVKVILMEMGTNIIPVLVEHLNKKTAIQNEYRCRGIIDMLGEMGDQKAVNPLMEKLTARSEYIRRGAVIALGKIGDLDSVSKLIELGINDKSSYVKDETSNAIKNMPDSVVQILIKNLKHKDARYRLFSAKVLGTMGMRARGALYTLEKMATNDSNKKCRQKAKESAKNILK